MKNLIKLLFICTLVLSYVVCYAGEADELAELQTAILIPITKNFNEDSSLTKKMSKAIINQEIATKTHYKKEQIMAVIHGIIRGGLREEDVDAYAREVSEVCEIEPTVNKLINKYVKSWVWKKSNCVNYANFVIVAFEFNQMNKQITRGEKLLFREARYVETYGNTGMHVFVLVEGVSGTIFAVDPWIHKIVPLPVFPKLSAIHEPIYELSGAENAQLSRLFGVMDKASGEVYYDVKYVNFDTKWRINATKEPLCLVHKLSPEVQVFYNTFQGNFPLWKHEYSAELFKQDKTPAWCKEKSEEGKKS